MTSIWYRADAQYVHPKMKKDDGTDMYFNIPVKNPESKTQIERADLEAIRIAKEWASNGQDFIDIGHVGLDLVQIVEVDAHEECFPEIRIVWH